MSARTRERLATSIAAAGLLALAATGCTAAGGPATEPTAAPSSSASTTSPRPTPTPPPFAFPPAGEDEIARAEFRDAGASGVPESSSTAGAIEVDSIAIEGQCQGSSMQYRLSAATADARPRIITEGRIMCDAPVRNQIGDLGYTGPAQLSISNANTITEGWVVVVPLE